MKKAVWIGWLVFALAGCVSFSLGAVELGEGDPEGGEEPRAKGVEAQPAFVSLPDLGPAPELHNEVWLNVKQPLRLADLRGNVVLLEMWTFG